jgi:hypothetical protein
MMRVMASSPSALALLKLKDQHFNSQIATISPLHK